MKKNKSIIIITIVVLLILAIVGALVYVLLNKGKSSDIKNESTNLIANTNTIIESSNESSDFDSTLDRAYQASIDTKIADFDDKVTFKALQLKTEIMAQMNMSDIPSITLICEKFIEDMKTEFNNEGENKAEGYVVTAINGSDTDSEDIYIVITFSSTNLRSSFPEDITKDSNYDSINKTWNKLKVVDDYSADSALLARVIQIKGYTATASIENILCNFNTDINTIIANSSFMQ